MDTHIEGFRPPDETWQKMKAIWDACAAVGVDCPDEVSEFFDDEAPNDAGQVVDIDDAVTEYSREMVNGYEIDLTKLPPGLTKIRVEIRY